MDFKSDFQNINESDSVSQKLKYKYFELLNKMLDFHHNSFLIELLFLIVQTFQLIGILEFSWMHNSSFTSGLLDIAQKFLFVPFFDNKNNNYEAQFKQLFYFSCIFIVILVIWFTSSLLLIESNENQNGNQKLQLSQKILFCSLDFIINATTQIFYIPFFQLLASTFKCEKNVNNQYSQSKSLNSYFNTITKEECFSGIQILHFFLSVILMILLYYFCKQINAIYYDSRLDCTYKNSKYSGEYETSIQNFASTYCLIKTFLLEEKYQIIQITIAITWCFFLSQLLYKNVLHNYSLFFKIKLEQILLVLWTSLLGAYNYFFPGSSIVAFFWIIGIIFLTIFNIFYEVVTNEYCAANSYTYKYANDAFQQLRVLCFAIQKYEMYSIKVDGFLNKHRNDCNEPTCPSRSNSVRIKKLGRMLVNQSTNEDLIMSIYVIYTIFNSNIRKFGGSNKIRLLYALFLLETIQSKDQALIQLQFITQNQPILEEEFMSFRLRKIIIKLQNLNEYKKLDFSTELSTDECSSKFKKNLNSAIQAFMNFWQELLEQQPQAQNLLTYGYQIQQQSDLISSQFEQLRQQMSINQSAYRSFQNFCLNFLEDKELFQTLQKQNQDQNNQQKENEDSEFQKEEDLYTQGTIVISTQEENFANIVEINSEMLKIIGLPKSQVASKNISFLIPSIWQQHHNQFIDQFLSTGKKILIGKKRDLFLKIRQDYSVPIKLTIKAIPSNIEGLLFQASIEAQNLLYDYPAFIITSVNGQIESVSPSALAMFNIDMKKVKQGMYIEKVIPSFWEYILDFQQKQGKELILKTYQIKMMKEQKVKINAEQIRFLNLGSQGYIISIRQCKSQKNNDLSMNQTKIQEYSFSEKQSTMYKAKKPKENQTSLQDNDSFNIQNNNTTQNQTKTNRSSLQKQIGQLEIFYDMRTNSFLGTIVGTTTQNNYDEPESDTIINRKTKSKFNSNLLNRQRQVSSKSQFSTNSYPFIYTSERNEDERIQDILQNNTNSTKQKADVIDGEIQNILENLIKMQVNKSKKKGKLSSKSDKKSASSEKNDNKIIPLTYLKSYEIIESQDKFIKHIEIIINIEETNLDNQSQSICIQRSQDYAENIKTMRLQENKLIDPKILNENEEQNSEESNQNFENNQEMQYFDSLEADYKKELDEITNSKKNIKSFMGDRNFNENGSLFTYKMLFQFLFLLIGIIYIILSLVLYQQQVNDSITRFQMYNTTHVFYANTQHIVKDLFNMLAIDKGVYYNYDSMDQQTARNIFEQHLEETTIYQFAIDDVLTKLYLNNVGVTQEMEDLFVNKKNIVLIMHFARTKSSVYPNNLYQVAQQVLAKVYHLKRVPLGQFNIHNNDIYMNLENFSNQMLNQLIQYRDLQEDEISTYLDQIQINQQKVIFIGFIIMLSYFLIVFIFYLKTLFYYYEIPSLLTSIPLSQIRLQVKKCEQFIKNTVMQDDEDHFSNEVNEVEDQKNKFESSDNIQKNKSNIYNSLKSQKSKVLNESKLQANQIVQQQKQQNQVAIQNEQSNNETEFSLRGLTSQNMRPIKYNLFNIQFMIPSIFALIFFSVFITVDNILTNNFNTLLQSFYRELTFSLKIEPEVMLLFNSLKSQTIANNNIGIRQVYEPVVYFKQNVNYIYDLLENLTYNHYNNFENLPSSYQIQYDEYFSQNPDLCNQMNQKYPLNINKTECLTFLNGKLTQGLSINIEHLITQMIVYSQTVEKSDIDFPYKQSVNFQMYEIFQICTYLRYMMRELNDSFINGIQLLSSNLNLVRISISLSSCSLLFLIFLFISIPITQRIKSQIFQQRLLFCQIPQNLLAQNKHIRQFILKQYLSNSKK